MIPSSITVDQVIGRIGKQVNAAADLHVQPQNIKKLLMVNHLNLHLIMPNKLREYLTRNDSLALTTGLPTKHLLLTGLPFHPKEIQSVGFIGTDDMQPYKRAISLEHFTSLRAYDEDREDGRYWLQSQGDDKLLIFQGTNVAGQETTLYVGYVKEMSTDYSVKTATFDCPPEAVKFVIAQTVVDCLIDKKTQIPEYLGQDLQNQQGLLTQMDAAISNQFRALEQTGSDIR